MRLFRKFIIFLTSMAALGIAAIAGVYFYLAPKLPSVEMLRDIHFQVPLQVYTSDNLLLAEYGSKKRDPVSYEQIPEPMINAVLAAEDNRFFQHPGVDYQGILRAVYQLLKTGQKAQGGSTITMQVARNFFLSREKTYLRKINEILLSFKIEEELTKEEILELYLNKIYLGNRAYGIGSAAQIYYGKPLAELSLAQSAMIAGLPKAPSRYNPIVNPQRAVIRRDYVLNRMLELGYITAMQHDQAQAEAVSAEIHKAAIDMQAPYIGEMVRSYMYERFGEDAYTHGYKAYVTINPQLQDAAQNALRSALMDYERRHGYRGPVKHIELQLTNGEADQQALSPLTTGTEDESETAAEGDQLLELVLKELNDTAEIGNLKAALVYKIEDQSALALLKDGQQIHLPWDGLAWAAPYIDTNTTGAKPQTAADILKVGDIVYVQETKPNHWALGQIPEVAGAIVALNPKNGALIALAGGFDFFHTKFNRAVQAKRQPGSSFKPFVYSAALEKGFTLASIINDAPVVFDDPGLEASWRPENYSGRIYGPTRLREALVRSRNLVSIRLLQNIGIRYTINYAKQFGFDPERLPKDLSLSLGSAAVTPLELANAYAVFANGGFSVSPYFIERIENSEGEIIFAADPAIACLECEKQLAQQALEQPTAPPSPEPPTADESSPEIMDTEVVKEEVPPAPKLAKRIIPEQNVYLVTSMMRDVILRGTGRRALQLGRKDLSGKTGTTNDQRDAWFAGFNSDIVTISWTGFDNAQPLGNNETGAKAALPMWISFMRQALKGTPETPLRQPPGLVTMRIDPETGLQASGKGKAIFETFRIENAPEKRAPDIDESITTPDSGNEEEPAQQLLF